MTIERPPAAGLLAAFDDGPLTARYWLLIVVLMAHGIVELFDFYLIGYLISVIGPQWGLTFGQASLILLSAGPGQICGALPLARAADRWGRKPLLIAGVVLYAASAGAVALVPDHGWILFASLRFLVGVGFAGANTAQITLIVEFSPTRWRTLISNASGALASIGVLLASASAAAMLGALGWRSLAALGAAPILFAVVLLLIAPESPRWLISRGRGREARAVIARYLGVAADRLPLAVAATVTAAPRMRELYADRGRFWLVVAMTGCLGLAGFCVALWGPTLVSLLLGIPPRAAAGYFIWVSLAGLAGRTLFTIVPHRIGRWRATLICLCASAVILAVEAILHGAFIGALPVFFLGLLLGAVFYDGGFTNIAPYAVELFPVQLAAQGGGLGQTVTGLAKLLGPVLLALIAGSGNILSPKATAAAIVPAFLTLAAVCALSAVVVSRLRYESHGASLSRPQVKRRRARSTDRGDR